MAGSALQHSALRTGCIVAKEAVTKWMSTAAHQLLVFMRLNDDFHIFLQGQKLQGFDEFW